MSSIKLTTLPSGLRVITDTVDSVHSVALGIWVDVGTRDEDMEHNGAAHMVEHMLFKGTKRRGPAQIAEEIENVGGYVNAYTSREITSYHIHLLKDHVKLALDMLADIYQNATLPQDEIERERHVILQEIGMATDTPDDLIFDNYFETAYPDQTLGAPILGKAHHVKTMKRETMSDYIRRYYTPGRTVISAAGHVDHKEFVSQVESLFSSLPPDSNAKHLQAEYKGGEHRLEKKLEQAHIVLGFPGLSRLDDDYHVAQALSAILGGGMSSRLFQEVREKRGLVYSVYSFHSSQSDSGQFCIYAGTGEKDLKELIPVVCDEIVKATRDISEAETARAKAQMKSGLLMARESMMTRAEQQAKYLLYRDRLFDADALIEKVNSITTKDVMRVAGKIFSGTPTLASLGPVKKMESYDKIVKRLAV